MRHLRKLVLATVLLGGLACGCEVGAQVVQLPVMHQTSYTGSVLVPDQGTAYLGGNSYYASGSVSRGPFLPSRAIGSVSGSSSISASVQIIDLAALDQAILNSAAPSSTISSQINRTAAISDEAAADKARKFLSDYNPAKSTAPQGGPNYREFNQAGKSSDKQYVEPGLAESNVRYYLKLGQEAEAANRLQSARVYYKMAMEAMTPELMERYQRVVAEKSKADEAKKKAKPARRQF